MPWMRGQMRRLLDSHNQIRLLKDEICLKKEEAFGPYFSVFSLGGTVEGVNISGAKYPLRGHTLMPYDSLCVSNEFEADEVEISFAYGTLILMETRD